MTGTGSALGTTGEGPYGNYESCSWKIQVPAGKVGHKLVYFPVIYSVRMSNTNNDNKKNTNTNV